ncbi:MAG TPA: hypothetical protein VKW08_10240 [Xanthobacteraceae bacterium]|jgi:hypothetical protein|nr:hypothetical protein [Xanthobacteraceae bacterium]
MLARICPDCGSQAKPGARLVVGGALLFLLIAILLAATAVLRWQQLDSATTTGPAADEFFVASSTADFNWLSTAMRGCDTIAKNEPGALHFLVTPLAAPGGDLALWRAKSINDKGEGILLRANDALEGLKQASLRIYPADYVFSLMDEASRTVYRWRPATGAARFSSAAAASVSSFTVQFRTSHGRSATWGTSFNRMDGSCYWVNPVIVD